MTAPPHGGKLVQIKTVSSSPERNKDLSENSKIRVSDETRVQMFNIATGILSPLTGFMGKAEYENVLENARLLMTFLGAFPCCCTFQRIFQPGNGDEITLVDENNKQLGQLEFEELFAISKKEYAKKVFGTEDEAHPGVAKIYASLR